MYVWIIACIQIVHTEKERASGQIAPTGLLRCVTARTASMADMQPRPKEGVKRATADRATRPLQEMNCIASQKNYARSFSLYVAQFQSLLINDGTETA